MNAITSRLATALRNLADQADAASSDGRFADGMGSELTALEDAREVLSAHDAQQPKRAADMTDDEIIAELMKPDMRYTVEFSLFRDGPRLWCVYDNRERRIVLDARTDKRAAVIAARALNSEACP